MDAFLRPLLSALSARPELARWLATDDLVRQLAAAIDQASAGGSPARDFKVIAPSSGFVPAGRGDRRTIDPASYRRYDGLVQTVTSIDASRVAQIYKTIRPRLNDAYRGMGHPEGNVDAAIQRAIDILLDTPAVKDPIALTEGAGGGWAYADRRPRRSHADAKAIVTDGTGARRRGQGVAARAASGNRSLIPLDQ